MWDLVASPGAREEHNRCARYRHHHNSAARHTTSRKGRTRSRKHKFASFAVVFRSTFLHGWFGKTITTEKTAPPDSPPPDLITPPLSFHNSLTTAGRSPVVPVWRLPDNKQSNSLIKINPFLICKICQTVGNGNFSEIGNIYPLRKASASMTHNSLY